MSEMNRTLPANVRVMIAIVAFPTLVVVAFVAYAIVKGEWQSLSISGVVFSCLSLLAYYIVITGRLPFFFHYFNRRK